MEKKVTVIGGLGKEKRNMVVNGKTLVYDVVGGSAWFSAIALRALSYNVDIISRLGDDANALEVQKTLDSKNISFIGNKIGNTQIFESIIVDGESQKYVAKYENQSILEFLKLLPFVDISDIIIVTYNDDLFFYHVPIEIRKIKKDAFLVANPSSAIYNMKYNFFELVKGYDIVTMNTKEIEYLANISKKSVNHTIFKILEHNKYVFITGKNKVVYSYNNEIYEYNFEPLHNVNDATGAGDAFASTISILLFHNSINSNVILRAVKISHEMCKTFNKDNIVPGQWSLLI